MREDISANLHALQNLHSQHATDILLIESGGDNLAANYSRELADFIIYVIDVAGGDKVPRKGGPGITGSDCLVINKVSWDSSTRGKRLMWAFLDRLGGSGRCGFERHGEGCWAYEVGDNYSLPLLAH